MKKLFGTLKKWMCAAVLWYMSAWWKPLIPAAIILAAMGIADILMMLCLGPQSALNILLMNWIIGPGLLLMLFLMLAMFIAGIVHLCKKRFLRGFLVWIGIVPCFTLTILSIACVCFLSMFGPSEDHFADNLKLPENVQLSEPRQEMGGFASNDDYIKAPKDSFQYQVLSAINHGTTLAENETLNIPSLAKLLETDGGRTKLLRYLSSNPEWRLYHERSGLYATRRFLSNGKPCSTLHNYYSHFRADNMTTGKKDGAPEDHYQFRLGIGLDGNSWRNASFWKTRPGCTQSESNGTDYCYHTGFFAGKAFVEIYDESEFSGRQMTAKTIKLLEKEFAAVMNGTAALPPPETVTKGKQDIVLYNGFQGGLYNAEVFCNPGEPGKLYLKAYEITKGTRLSANRLEAACNEVSGWSDNPEEQFCSQMGFTIYEGDWNQFYGARFEVWFKPDSGKSERKLFEKNFKIQGWMR
jgi:hypothetical protein